MLEVFNNQKLVLNAKEACPVRVSGFSTVSTGSNTKNTILSYYTFFHSTPAATDKKRRKKFSTEVWKTYRKNKKSYKN